jgi:hypothetical protein
MLRKPVGLEAQLLRVADSEGTVHFAKVRVGEDADDYLRPASGGSILPFVAYSDDRRAASGGKGGSYDDAPAASRAKGGGELGGDVAPQGRVELLADEAGFAHRARRLEDPLGGEAGLVRESVSRATAISIPAGRPLPAAIEGVDEDSEEYDYSLHELHPERRNV